MRHNGALAVSDELRIELYYHNRPVDIYSLIRHEFPHQPIMVEVARCESGMRQFKGGEVIKNTANRNGTVDYGVFQINSIHLPTAQKLGIDIMTLEGNIEMAKVILKSQGLNAWNPSRHCWGKYYN